MKKSRFIESHIAAVLKKQESGVSVKIFAAIQELVIKPSTWKAKYDGMDSSQLKKVKELEEENSRLKRMYAELSLMNDALKHVIEKKL